jgi:hypothetical protein
MNPNRFRRPATRALAALFLLTLLQGPATAEPPPPADREPPVDLAGPGAARLVAVRPDALLRELDPKATSTAFLVEGTRPPDDRPGEETRVLGDGKGWLLVETGFGRGAIRVTGLPAPPPREPVALTGRLVTEGGEVVSLSGIRFLVDGDRGAETVARPGDFIRYTLPGGMPGKEPGLMVRRLPIESVRVEIDGEAAAEAFNDRSNVLVVRAVKPGVAKIRFFAHVSGEKAPRPMGQHALRVAEPGPAR